MPAPLLQAPGLGWGVLAFVGAGAADSPFDIEAMAGGTHFGNPVPVVEIVRSLLIDGALAAVTGWENREIPIRLRVSANDGEALAEAEAALVQQCLLDQPPPLVWTSAVGDAAPSVFDTVVATLDRDTADGWDLAEQQRGYRYYVLTLRCLPFARAMESTVVPALPVPEDPGGTVTWTNIDGCGSTTGWTRETNGSSPTGPTALTDSGQTYVEVDAFITSPNQYLRLVRTGSFSVPAGHYIVIDALRSTRDQNSPFGRITGSWRANINGTYYDPVAVVYGGGEHPAADRLWFEAPAPTITSLKVLSDFETLPYSGVQVGVAVFNVATTDTIGDTVTSTLRQQSRLVTVAGSMPTQAAIRLYDATPAALGTDILIHTSRRTDWTPNLRRWIDTSEAITVDAAMVSRARHTLAIDTVFLLPSDLVALGTYALVARMNISTAGTLTWEARMATSGGATTTPGGSVIASGEIDLAVTSGYEVLNLAALILPVVEVEGGNYTVKLTLGGTANMSLDEAWLFNLDDGALTWVHDTETLEWLEVRSPELGATRPSVWGGRGTVGVRAACVDWKCKSFGSHRFEPGIMQIFTICTTSLKSQCEIEFFPRFHSNVWGGETA